MCHLLRAGLRRGIELHCLRVDFARVGHRVVGAVVAGNRQRTGLIQFRGAVHQIRGAAEVEVVQGESCDVAHAVVRREHGDTVHLLSGC